MKLSLLYRGPLESCNYGCDYCPFAKKVDDTTTLAKDQRALFRFVDWVATRDKTDTLGVLFTPWGEALIRPWYRDALAQLSHMPQVIRAAIQTNLSVPLGMLEDWTARAVPGRLGVWATYHPGWTKMTRFVSRVTALHARGVSVTAGAVGFSHFLPEIRALRAALPRGVYLWINAPKSREAVTEETTIAMEHIDPLYRLNTVHHQSEGELCGAGHTAVSVLGDGTVRRCHFIEAPIGNLYDPNFERALKSRLCTQKTCGCHIGYVHLRRLQLDAVFQDGILERNPALPVLNQSPSSDRPPPI